MTPSELSFAIKVRQLDTLLSRRTPAWAVLVLTLEIPYFFWGSVSNNLVYIWIGLNLLIFVRAFWFYPWLIEVKRTEQNINKLLAAFAFNVSTAGLVWSIMLPFFFVPDSPHLLLVFFFTYSILIVAGSIALASYMPAFISYWLPFVISLSVLFFSLDETGFFGYGEGFLLFNGFIALLYRTTNKEVIELISLQFEKENLVEDLEVKNKIAEKLAADKSRFLAAASHDLRQPLHASGLLLSTLKNYITNQEGERLLDGAMTSMAALSNSFDSLLDVSKLDAGTVEIDLQHYPLNQIFNVIEQEFSVQAESKGVVFGISQHPVVVHTDPELFSRVLRNLVSNAVKYTDNGSVNISWETGDSSDTVIVRIRDTGVGIPKDELDNIFSEYYQLHNPERDRNKGFGLGLAIVKRLSNLLEIDLRVHSEVGAGTEFLLTLKKGDSAFLTKHDVSSPPVSASLIDKYVLVIDDDLGVLNSMQELLSSWGCAVCCAESEDQAVQKMIASNKPPDLVLADYRLRNNRTGIQAYELVCEEFNRQIPVIIITGDTSPDRLQILLDSGYRLLHKPVSAEQLREAMMLELGESD